MLCFMSSITIDISLRFSMAVKPVGATRPESPPNVSTSTAHPAVCPDFPGSRGGLRRIDVEMVAMQLTGTATVGGSGALPSADYLDSLAARSTDVVEVATARTPGQPPTCLRQRLKGSEYAQPVDRDRCTAQHWRRALRATEMRPRNFYATRHTFISLAMTKGMPLKLVATYCGTSVEMIEQHYGKWLSDDMGRWLEHVTAKTTPADAVATQNP
jgi:hypothetical protein